MNRNSWIAALIILALGSFACSTLTGGESNPTPAEDITPPPGDTSAPTSAPDSPSGGGSDTSNAGFPLPPDATDVTDMGDSLVTFQTDLTLQEAMDFYRAELESQGYTERTILTVTSETTFSFVFDGHESGKALVIQGVDFSGNRTVTLSLQDV